MELVINEKFKKAFSLMNDTIENLFITGNAGTGKSTLLRYFVENTNKNVAIVAPTGVAAVNVGGETIHSFFAFAPNVSTEDVYKFPSSNPRRSLINGLDTLVIDEISMVRADLLDAVDKSLRLNRGRMNEPFGGVQMIFFGDLLQLPPVLANDEKDSYNFMYQSPYFFDSYVIRQFPLKILQLEEIFRQQDVEFIDILNSLRSGKIEADLIDKLNQRVIDSNFDFENYVYLSSTNKIAEAINSYRLKSLDGMAREVKAEIYGEFRPNSSPVPEVIYLKQGARVMLQNNDKENRWVNGTMATVTDFDDSIEGECTVTVKTDDGGFFHISPYSWEMYKYSFDLSTNRVNALSVGSFSQLPLKLAWAVTIHKSQGKSFDKVIVDLGYGAFAHGQTYVALSRCRTLDGLLLKRPVNQKDLIVDKRVLEWLENSVIE